MEVVRPQKLRPLIDVEDMRNANEALHPSEVIESNAYVTQITASPRDKLQKPPRMEEMFNKFVIIFVQRLMRNFFLVINTQKFNFDNFFLKKFNLTIHGFEVVSQITLKSHFDLFIVK